MWTLWLGTGGAVVTTRGLPAPLLLLVLVSRLAHGNGDLLEGLSLALGSNISAAVNKENTTSFHVLLRQVTPYGLFTYTETDTDGYVYGYTAQKQGQISVHKWLLQPFSGQDTVSGQGCDSVSMYVNEPLETNHD